MTGDPSFLLCLFLELLADGSVVKKSTTKTKRRRDRETRTAAAAVLFLFFFSVIFFFSCFARRAVRSHCEPILAPLSLHSVSVVRRRRESLSLSLSLLLVRSLALFVLLPFLDDAHTH